MLNKKHKLLELKTKTLVDSLYVWNYKTKHKWVWIEFVDFREYNFWDNIKNIDFIKSQKEGKTLVRLYEEEKELSIYFIIDLNKSYLENYNKNKSKKDILYEIIYLIWLSAIKDWNKVWALINNNSNNKLFFAKKWKQNFINIINKIENNLLFKEEKKININLKNFFIKENNLNKKINNNELKIFNSLKIKNSLVFYITDKLEFDLKDLKILSIKNDLIFCNIFNSFENNLSWNWIIWIDDIDLKIDLENRKKILEYKKQRELKISDLRQIIIKYSWKYILLDETKNIYNEFYKLFKY